MAVHKLHRHAPGTFTAISNSALKDVRLSLAARGLLAFLLTHHPGWRPNARDLAKRTGTGRTKMLGLMNELQACGYLHRYRSQDGQGQWTWECSLFEEPWCEELTMDQSGTGAIISSSGPALSDFPSVEPESGLPSTVQPSSANRTVIETEAQRELKKQKEDPVKLRLPLSDSLLDEIILSNDWHLRAQLATQDPLCRHDVHRAGQIIRDVLAEDLLTGGATRFKDMQHALTVIRANGRNGGFFRWESVQTILEQHPPETIQDMHETIKDAYARSVRA
jgi:hypothetical protein